MYLKEISANLCRSERRSYKHEFQNESVFVFFFPPKGASVETTTTTTKVFPAAPNPFRSPDHVNMDQFVQSMHTESAQWNCCAAAAAAALLIFFSKTGTCLRFLAEGEASARRKRKGRE